MDQRSDFFSRIRDRQSLKIRINFNTSGGAKWQTFVRGAIINGKLVSDEKAILLRQKPLVA